MKKRTLFLLGFLSFLCTTLILQYLQFGIPHLGLPDAEEVVQVQLTDTRFSAVPRILTDKEELARACALTGTLGYTLAAPEESAPAVTITYLTKSGEMVEIAANESTVWYRGKAHPLRQGELFLNLVEGLFPATPEALTDTDTP